MYLPITTKGFLNDEDGAVSTDWVLLTAFCVGVGIAATYTLGTSVASHGNEIDGVLTNRGIPSYNAGSTGAGL